MKERLSIAVTVLLVSFFAVTGLTGCSGQASENSNSGTQVEEQNHGHSHGDENHSHGDEHGHEH